MRLLKDRVAQRALAARMRSNMARALAALGAGGAGRVRGQVLCVEEWPVSTRIVGWVRDAASTSVVVEVNGSPVGVTRPGPDVSIPAREDLRLPTGAVGWELRCHPDELPQGEISLTARALRGNGLVDELVGVVAHTDGARQLGIVDLPAANTAVPVVFDVAGWIRTDAAIDVVEICVDDRQVVAARLFSVPRPDIAALRGDDPWSSLAGWQATIVLAPDEGDRWHADASTSPRRVKLTTWAVAGGRRHLIDTRELDHIPARTTSAGGRLPVVRTSTPESRGTAHRTSEALRLLVANHHLGLGGGQLYLFELVRQMLRIGPMEITVLTEIDGVLRSRLEDMGVTVRAVGSAPPTAAHYEDWADVLTAYAAELQPDVVLANTAGCFWGIDIAHRIGVPSVWSVHESFDPELFLRHYYGDAVDGWTRARFYESFARASAVVFEADATKSIFRHLADPARLIRIDYGVDLADIASYVAEHPRAELRARLGLKPDDIAFVCIGTYEPRKAQGLLAKAFLDVAARFPHAQLVLVGDSPNQYSEALHRALAAAPGTSQVRTVGITGDVYDWYHAADAFVLASDVESLSRAMLEAMAFGAVPVVSDVFGTSSVVSDGSNGILFDPTRVSSVRDAIERFASLSRDERDALSDAARRTVNPARDSQHYGLEYRMLLDELASDPGLSDFTSVQTEARSLRHGADPAPRDEAGAKVSATASPTLNGELHA